MAAQKNGFSAGIIHATWAAPRWMKEFVGA
jgi:hypothetical protein